MPEGPPDESRRHEAEPGRRLGVFGGTFDPPHIAHLVAALEVRHQLALDEVWLVVANEPWQKVGVHDVSPAAERLAMVRAAVADLDGLIASDVEIQRGGLTYTVDTLREIRRREPAAELFLVVGADAAAGLDTWKDLDEVRRLARLVVVTRPALASDDRLAGALDELRGDDRVDWVEIPRLDVESNDIRRRIAEGRPVELLVPAAVASVIREHALYGGALV
jgi:nicotinate-nucleotide adenylyltransferase